MTQNTNIEDLLYFKGIINNYNIDINLIENTNIIDNLKIIVSVIN